jgi:two-component system chemotaxis response regulator CheB
VQDTSRIIVIGASAGGVQVLRMLARTLPDDIAAPILVVLHIGAHRSLLPEILNLERPHRALFAQTGQAPLAGHIYVAPPDRHLLIEDGLLQVVSGPKEHHARPAIDPLFRSAALGFGRRAIGVILTGMLDDGSAGLRAIKVCGGTTVVQDPAEAAEPSMPASAMATSKVDHVARIDTMAPLLGALAAPLHRASAIEAPDWLQVEHAVSLGRGSMDELATIGNPSRFTCPDCGGALFELTQEQPLRFLCHTGHAFSLRSLAWAHGLATDEALWAGLRALQEKEAILRRLAKLQAGGAAATSLGEADELARFIASMRAVIDSTPAATFELATELPPSK